MQSHEGWTNKETWCVALTFNNTKALQDEVLKHMRGNIGYPATQIAWLRHVAYHHSLLIMSIAPWCWEVDGYHGYRANENKVNWEELREHFQLKIEEERQVEL